MPVWNYRPMRKRIEVKDPKVKAVGINSHWIYGLHETYYKGIGDEKISSWAVDSTIGYFSDIDDMIEELTLMLKDAKKYKNQILDYDKTPRWNTEYQKDIRNILNE